MISIIRQIIGKSRREAEGDRLAECLRQDLKKGEKEVKAQRLVLERLVAEIGKDTTAWH
ncbi:hypothetical protein PE067_10730 [Paracoccus sp. DMF-8]|uniref:hypothetical protein n=1 Tax=Paracoccus sp. DMF-8 TaxID=3019445 RepID=UPI0023E83FDA|nr:hypothetical protein [Paracoccus sp. DMF-8]MDF3606576.1 hypothetical protein [Paracoccus sp. DMF-8]